MTHKNIIEKAKFILFSISYGVVIWMLTISFRTLLSSKDLIFSNPISKFIIFIFPIYFVGKITEKIQWNAFEKYSKIITFLIMILVAILLFITIRM